MKGFWGGRCEKYYADVKVFNPHAPLTAPLLQGLFIIAMVISRSVHMKVRCSLVLLLFLSSLQQVGWLIKLLCYTNALF